MRNTKLLMMAIMAGVCAMSLCGCEKSSETQANLCEYLKFDGQGGYAATVLQGEPVEFKAMTREDGSIFVDIEMLQKYIDDRFYFDKTENYILFTDATHTITSYVGENQYVERKEKQTVDYTISMLEGDICYINMEYVKMFCDLNYKLYKAAGNKPERLVINDFKPMKYTEAKAKKNNKMRVDMDTMSDIVVEIDKDESLRIIKEEGEWYSAQTEDGFTGYVQKKYNTAGKKKSINPKNDDETYTHTVMEEKVKMVWHQVTNVSANDTLSSMSADMAGVNAISPTWYTMKDGKGSIVDLSSSNYVKKAHNMGCKVWPLVDDFSKDSNGNKYVDTVLASTTVREEFEDNLISSLLACGADGLNVDFEYISKAYQDDYHQFLRELSIKCKENSLTLSIDNYVPTEFSEYYDMKQQGKLADYVMVMSYDEYNSASDAAGPVASLPFVQKAVSDTVDLVGDASRVIMGIPFYTRVWTETPEEFAADGAKIIEDSANGNYALSSKAVGMETAKDICRKAKVTPEWNEEMGCDYAYIENEHGNTQIWLENAKSIRKKIDVANEYGIGGCGCWKLGFETKDIWDVIDSYGR
ncbi:MAG: hypothetical protein K6G88_00030 [Lachnospiraceae bacterium]|nr:hypothetical protein [Lachnospiraceae bacterium]